MTVDDDRVRCIDCKRFVPIEKRVYFISGSAPRTFLGCAIDKAWVHDERLRRCESFRAKERGYERE